VHLGEYFQPEDRIFTSLSILWICSIC